jgi:L-alanine-DL-glutamate epimerase-like enolase superfamily enzyme
MVRAVRNVGRAGVASGAITAVDAALLGPQGPLVRCGAGRPLGPVRDGVEVYGSGGFTSYSTDEVAQRLAGWVEAGISKVKMKVGSDPAAAEAWAVAARTAMGPTPSSMSTPTARTV